MNKFCSVDGYEDERRCVGGEVRRCRRQTMLQEIRIHYFYVKYSSGVRFTTSEPRSLSLSLALHIFFRSKVLKAFCIKCAGWLQYDQHT